MTENARSALDVAAAMALQMKARELWLIHVIDERDNTLDCITANRIRTSARDRLREEAEWALARWGMHVYHMVLAGRTTDTFLGFAAAKQAELVVVASQRHGTSPFFRLHGVSEPLVQAAHIPVLVVRKPEPFVAWANGTHRLRLLLAADGSKSCDAAIRWVRSLRRMAPVDVTAGYIYFSSSGRAGVRHGLSWPPEVEQTSCDVEAFLARDILARVGDLDGEGQLTARPKLGTGRVGDHLMELAAEEGADLIVLGTHHRWGLARLTSVATDTLHRSQTSVAVVP